MVHLSNYSSFIRSGIIGHAVGDALGVPVEFSNRAVLAKNPVTDMREYGTHNMPVGTWSDDTSMEIALIASLIERKGFDYDDIMNRFYDWYRNGQYTATGVTFDIGCTCSRAISNYRSGMSADECGEKSEYSNGNGSLMRILPAVFVCVDMRKEEKCEIICKVSSLTHAHEISVLGCYIFAQFVLHLMQGCSPVEAYSRTKEDDYSMFSADSLKVYSRILDGDIAERKETEISGSGFVVHSLEAALWCLLNSESYREATLKAVNLGDDTDTVGAITGAIAGIYYGYEAIPNEWLAVLKRRDYLLELCDQFSHVEISV